MNMTSPFESVLILPKCLHKLIIEDNKEFFKFLSISICTLFQDSQLQGILLLTLGWDYNNQDEDNSLNKSIFNNSNDLVIKKLFQASKRSLSN